MKEFKRHEGSSHLKADCLTIHPFILKGHLDCSRLTTSRDVAIIKQAKGKITRARSEEGGRWRKKIGLLSPQPPGVFRIPFLLDDCSTILEP